jgi:hypothetical protein
LLLLKLWIADKSNGCLLFWWWNWSGELIDFLKICFNLKFSW